MIVFCEECGEKHLVDPGSMKSDREIIRCRVCNEEIIVIRPRETPGLSNGEEGETR
jgi:hypothetical protein